MTTQEKDIMTALVTASTLQLNGIQAINKEYSTNFLQSHELDFELAINDAQLLLGNR